jgi:hypothetical protein
VSVSLCDLNYISLAGFASTQLHVGFDVTVDFAEGIRQESGPTSEIKNFAAFLQTPLPHQSKGRCNFGIKIFVTPLFCRLLRPLKWRESSEICLLVC